MIFFFWGNYMIFYSWVFFFIILQGNTIIKDIFLLIFFFIIQWFKSKFLIFAIYQNKVPATIYAWKCWIICWGNKFFFIIFYSKTLKELLLKLIIQSGNGIKNYYYILYWNNIHGLLKNMLFSIVCVVGRMYFFKIIKKALKKKRMTNLCPFARWILIVFFFIISHCFSSYLFTDMFIF